MKAKLINGKCNLRQEKCIDIYQCPKTLAVYGTIDYSNALFAKEINQRENETSAKFEISFGCLNKVI